MSYPPPPGLPPVGPSGKPRLRGHTGIRVGAVLAIVGLAMLIAGVVVLGIQSLGKVNGFQRVNVAAGAGRVTFNGTGEYVAYYEARNVTNDIAALPLVELGIRNAATDQPVTIRPYGNHKITKLTYSYNNHRGIAVAQFDIATPGTYEVVVQGGIGVDPDADLAFGRSIERGTIVGGILAAFGGLLLVAGLIVLVIGLIRRRRDKQNLRAVGGYPMVGYPQPGYPQPGYPPPGYPPSGYPPPGYPPPGYPPPGYPQPGYPPSGYPQRGQPPPGRSGYPPGQPPAAQPPPSEDSPQDPWPSKE